MIQIEPFVFPLLVILLAVFVRSVFGFGDALVAMPLLSILLGLQTAAPLVALLSATIGALIVFQDWRQIDFRRAAWLILPAVFGIPVGLAALAHVDPNLLKSVLGALLLVFSSFALCRPNMVSRRGDTNPLPFGVLAGALGGAYNTPGPVLVIYGTMIGWSPVEFRATLQAFFLPTSVMIVVGHAAFGRLTFEVLRHYLFAIPVVVIAIAAGRMVNRRFSLRLFVRLVYGVLIVIAAVLLLDVLSAYQTDEVPSSQVDSPTAIAAACNTPAITPW